MDSRRLLRLSQDEMAHVFDVHVNTYARWERGEVEPSHAHEVAIEAIVRLARRLNPL